MLLCLGLAAAYLLVAPAQYTAVSQLLVENREAKVVSGNAVLSSLNADQYVIDTQVEIIRSSEIANQAARSIGLIKPNSELNTAQLKKIHDNMKVERVGLTFVIEISFTDKDPERAAAMTNAIASSYLQDQRDLKSKVIRKGHQWLETRTDQLRKEVAEADRRIQKYKERHKIVSSGDLTFGEQELTEYAKQLTEARASLAQAKARQSQRARNDFEISQRTVDVLEKGLDNLKARLANHDKVVVGLKELQREAEAASRIYTNFLTRLKETQAQDNLQGADARIISSALPPPKPSSPKKTIILGLALAFGLSLGVLYAMAREAFNDFVRSRQELIELLGISKAISLPKVKSLTRKVAISNPKLALESHGEPRVASVDNRPLKTRAGRKGRTRDKNGADARNAAGSMFNVNRYVLDFPASNYAQSIFLLAQQIDDARTTDQIFLMVSAGRGEGKTATAVSLARYIAASGSNVVLVDCNLRKPGVQEACADIAPVASTPLTEALETLEIKQQQIRADHQGGQLMIVTAPKPGEYQDNPLDILSAPNVAAFFDRCRQQADVILIDAPSLGNFVDSRILCKHADKVIVIAEHSRTKRGQLRTALNDASITPDHVLCVALNKAV